MASEPLEKVPDAPVKVGNGRDVFGVRWTVAVDEVAVLVCVGSLELVLVGDERDRFAEAVARAVTPGNGVHHGPECGCTPCLAEPSYRARRPQVREDDE